MNAHTEEQLKSFLEGLAETNATLGFWTDFNKVAENVADIEISLNTLNYLLGQPDLPAAVQALWNRDKSVFSVLPILIAVRGRDKKVMCPNGNTKLLVEYLDTYDGVMEFLNGTGLAEVFRTKSISNLVDYVFGIEVGLDSNGRKNRSGKLMEQTVAKVFREHGIPFRAEVNSTEYPDIDQALGKDLKRFDFVIETQKHTYLIETNFYSGGGSKPNETARAYTELSPKINAFDRYRFVWITDGQGWHSAKTKITAAYYAIPYVYSLSNIEEFIELVKSELQ